ncbi:hypothetical protein FHS29_004054 [Saccharothrix tamanrassetensis]|uniref:Uncharacterized protein n=1 Tax=Saccharothrix tamanrassetensis TaxID=1051531 RepID=A0A841CJI5_9PSEU|nr:hypothetical protein [Saccharothrix tamanrassetensis]MBB5957459.1 hypothetical protein [Saccharothrix tamanrassetensis]
MAVPGTTRRWAVAALCAPPAAFLVYVWGAIHMYAPDIRETCTLQHGGWDPAYGRVTYLPLSRKCNAYQDMVPSYVNPAVVALLAATALFVVLAVAARRNPRSRKEPQPP